MVQVGSQNGALSSASDWLIEKNSHFDWLRLWVPHRFSAKRICVYKKKIKLFLWVAYLQACWFGAVIMILTFWWPELHLSLSKWNIESIVERIKHSFILYPRSTEWSKFSILSQKSSDGDQMSPWIPAFD